MSNSVRFVATIVETQNDWLVLNGQGRTSSRHKSLDDAVALLTDTMWVAELEVPFDLTAEPAEPYNEDIDTEIRKRAGANPVNINMRAGENLCDFCSDAAPVWDYICPSYIVRNPEWVPNINKNVVTTSRGNWCACEACAVLIESHDWIALARRTADALYAKHPFGDKTIRFELVKHMQGLFREHYTGERVPYTKESV